MNVKRQTIFRDIASYLYSISAVFIIGLLIRIIHIESIPNFIYTYILLIVICLITATLFELKIVKINRVKKMRKIESHTLKSRES